MGPPHCYHMHARLGVGWDKEARNVQTPFLMAVSINQERRQCTHLIPLRLVAGLLLCGGSCVLALHRALRLSSFSCSSLGLRVARTLRLCGLHMMRGRQCCERHQVLQPCVPLLRFAGSRIQHGGSNVQGEGLSRVQGSQPKVAAQRHSHLWRLCLCCVHDSGMRAGRC